MKTTNIAMAILCAIAMMACNKENSIEPTFGTFTAELETPVDTKTQLGADGNSVVWRGGDEINIFAGNKNEKYSTTSSGTTSATFTGNPVYADTYYALYPYSATAQCNNGKITATLPTKQTANKGNLGNKMNLAVACSSSSELEFKNVGGLIKFEIKTKNVGEVILRGNNNEDIAGDVSIEWKNGVPEYTVVEGAKEISLKTYNNKVLEMGTYHFVVLPQTFEQGITITLKPYSWTTDEIVLHTNKPVDLTKSGNSSLELSRSHIKPVGAIDEGALISYSDVSVNCMRGTAKQYGTYIDFHTGRTFHPIGASTYDDSIEMLFVQGSKGIGFSSINGGNAQSWANTANLNKFGTSATSDIPSNWSDKVKIEFRWLTENEITDTSYEELMTTNQVKNLCTGTLVTSYIKNKDELEDYQITQERIDEGTHEYLVFKISDIPSGTYYGVIKFKNMNLGTPVITFDYKIGR